MDSSVLVLRPQTVQGLAATDVALATVLEADAARLRPGETGLVALDWWNGNRSILVDADLTGALLGTTLATRPADIYRALLEATVYGTRVIVETLETAGVPIEGIVACGGLPFQNRLLMQLTADITGRIVRVSASRQACRSAPSWNTVPATDRSCRSVVTDMVISDS